MFTAHSSPNKKNLRSYVAHSTDQACDQIPLEGFRADMVNEHNGKVFGLPTIENFIATFDLDDDLPLVLPEWPEDTFKSLEKLTEENDIAEEWVSG